MLLPPEEGALTGGLAVSVPAGCGLDEPDDSAAPAVPTLPVVPVLSCGVAMLPEELLPDMPEPEVLPDMPEPELEEEPPMLEPVALLPVSELPDDCLPLIEPHAASAAVHATSAIHLDIDITFSLKINDAASYCLRPRIVNCG